MKFYVNEHVENNNIQGRYKQRCTVLTLQHQREVKETARLPGPQTPSDDKPEQIQELCFGRQ